jgi:hypothetical protein
MGTNRRNKTLQQAEVAHSPQWQYVSVMGCGTGFCLASWLYTSPEPHVDVLNIKETDRFHSEIPLFVTSRLLQPCFKHWARHEFSTQNCVRGWTGPRPICIRAGAVVKI